MATKQTWTESDAVSLTTYLDKHPRVLEELERRMPAIDTASTEAAAMSGARHAGAEDLLKSLKDMQSQSNDVCSTDFIDPSKD